MEKKPNCYECVHRGPVAGDAHSCCNNPVAVVTGDAHGIRKGWFMHPFNFDPVWLTSCDGFSNDPKDKTTSEVLADPLGQILSILAKRF